MLVSLQLLEYSSVGESALIVLRKAMSKFEITRTGTIKKCCDAYIFLWRNKDESQKKKKKKVYQSNQWELAPKMMNWLAFYT